MPRCWAWAQKRELICRPKNRVWYLLKSGSSACTTTSGIRVRRFPLQVAYVIGGIASAGEFKQPHLLKDAQSVGDKQVPLAEHTVEEVTQGMFGVINEAGGTGNSIRLQGIEFCGKSGTAQMMSYSAASRLGLGKGKNDGWFVGFAPRRNPEIVVAAVVEDTSEHGGTAAGPVVQGVKPNLERGANRSETEDPKAVLKPEEAAAVLPSASAKRDRPE
jgi:membrane peptidoglycan carboxypeptidase